uniref:PARP catalytic domain-containing protein n=1 Tax=Electrophorus electricus TaxID=8005 RepID=A0A4W4E845_ELEEL
MWAEDDLGPRTVPCLQSSTEPVDGKIYLMYHGTSRVAAQQIMASGFRQSKDGMLGRGVYLSRDLNKASRYPLNLAEHERVVVRVKVNVGRVKKIDHQGHPLQKTWRSHGYDTAWCPPKCGMVRSGLEEDCVWDPECIKVIDIIYPTKDSCEIDCGQTFRVFY